VEAYNLNKDSLYTVEIVVKDPNGEIKKIISKQKRYGVKDAVEVGTTPIMNLSSGKYIFQIRILDGSMKEVVQAKRYLFINNPQVAQTTSPMSVKALQFLGMNADELEKEFRAAKYLATDQEIKTFSKINNAEGRREFLAKFWSDVENGKNHQTGITRAMYLDRILTANQRYHAMGKEGWQSDRGRVYLLYSEPDEVERFPSSTDAKPYEIWDYNQIESGVIFVFIDQSGFGDYRLVHSTKRGELQDESWKQHLQ
jgi:GWxTD domain-containing protein